jgi:hypothetical protein
MSKKREHKPTSKEGEEHIKPFKPNHKAKIKDALEKLRVGGTQEEIAISAGLRPDQAWKRLSELEKEGAIFNTGISRKLKSGVGGIVWQLTGLTFKEGDVPVIQKPLNGNKKIKQPVHNPLFDNLNFETK